MRVLRGCARAMVAVGHAIPPDRERIIPRRIPVAIAAAEQIRRRRCLVVYDGTCYFCHSGVRWLIKNDEEDRIRFCCLQSQLARHYMNRMNPKDVMRRIVVIEEEDDTCHQNSTAILKLLSCLPQPYSRWGTTLSYLPKSWLDSFYEFVVRKGHDWFGKGYNEILVLKEKELLHNFIDSHELLAFDHKETEENPRQ